MLLGDFVHTLTDKLHDPLNRCTVCMDELLWYIIPPLPILA